MTVSHGVQYDELLPLRTFSIEQREPHTVYDLLNTIERRLAFLDPPFVPPKRSVA